MRDLNNNAISHSVGSRRPGHKSAVSGWHQVKWIKTTGCRFLRWRQYPTDISLWVRFVDLMVFVSIEQPRKNTSMMSLDKLQTAHAIYDSCVQTLCRMRNFALEMGTSALDGLSMRWASALQPCIQCVRVRQGKDGALPGVMLSNRETTVLCQVPFNL